MRFLYKFILLLSSLVIISSFVQFFAFDRIFLTTNASLLLTTNEKAASNLGESLAVYFKKIELSLKTIASDPNIRNHQEILDKINIVTPEINAIFVLDKHGNVTLTSGIERIAPLNFSQREHFQHAIKGETYISDVYTSAGNRQVVAVATPIIENGNILGVVVGTVWLHESNLSSMFGNKSFGRNGFITITDGQGSTVYHPDKNLIGKKSRIADSLQGLAGSAIMKNDSDQEHYIGYRKIHELNWLVSVHTPTTEVAQLRSMMIYQLLAVTVLTILLVITIGTYTVRQYSKPLANIIEGLSSIKKGTYKRISSFGYATEFDEILHAYNDTIEKLEEVHLTLEVAADVDGLTGAYNRRSFDKILESLNSQMQSRSLGTLGIMLLDLDDLKQLNDIHGHLAGDDVLKEFTRIIISIAGARSVFRFGGDEFVVILRNIPYETIITFAEEIRWQCEEKLRGCTVSIGIAAYPKHASSIDELLNLADKALYISKNNKNTITEYQVIN